MIKVKDGYAKLINTTYTGSADRVLLSNGGDKAISDFAAASSLNNYVTLNTDQTITGIKTFSNSLRLNKGVSITDQESNGILGVNASTWTGVPKDGSAISLGTLNDSLYFRSSNDNIYHYRNDTKAVYKILDGSNCLDIVRPSGYIQSGTANLSSYWCKMWDITYTVTLNDLDLTLYVHSAYNNARGIIHIRIRPNPTYDSEDKVIAGVFDLTISMIQVTGNLPLDKFRLYYNSSGHCELWGNTNGLWGVYNYCLLSCTSRTSKENTNCGTFYSTNFSTALTLPTDTYYNLTNLNQITVYQHTSNNVEYPLVWSNLNNTNATVLDSLYKSYAHLLYNPSLKRITTGQYVANNGDGPHFTAQSASGKWAYIRLHNSSNYYDIGTRNDKGGLWLARPYGGDKGIFVSTAGKVAISSDLSKVTNDVPNELTVSGVSSFTSPNIPVHIKRPTTFPAIGYFGGDDANTIYGYIGFKDANNPAWCKTDGSTVYSFLHTGNSGISEYAVKINDTTANFVRDWGSGAVNMNDVAKGGRSSMGMASLSTPEGGTATAINPNGATNWHHFINISYTEGGAGSNTWVTQIANKAGTTDLWIRSRNGGSISNTTAWAAPWTRILTGSNYSSVLDSRYLPTNYYWADIPISTSANLETNPTFKAPRSQLMFFTARDGSNAGYVGRGSNGNDSIFLMGYTGNGVQLGTNGTTRVTIDTSGKVGINTEGPTATLHVNGDLFFNLGDPTLTIYSGKITDAKSDGNVCLQTCIDGANGQNSTYPPNYSNRHNLVLLPRGGLVYIGYNPDPGDSTYKLWINGNVYSNGYVEPNTGSPLKGIKFGNSSYLNSLNGLLIWQSSEAIRFGSSNWDWNAWAGLKYNHSLKTIYLGIADDVIFNSNNNTLSGGNIKFPGILYITLDNSSIIVTSNTTSNYRTLSEFYKGSSENSTYTYDAQIGWHNTGDTDGALVLLPYATNTNPWNATVGLYISKTRLLYNSNTVLISNNYASILDQRYYTETESDAKYAKLASPNNLLHATNEFTFASPAFSGEIHFNWRTSSGEKDGDITAYYFDDGKGSTLAKISKNFFEGSAASLIDSNNSAKVITASYASGGFSTNPSWLCAWNSYHITYVSPSVLEVKYATSAGSATSATQLSGSGVTSDPTPNSNGTLSVCYGGGSGYTGTTSMAFAAILNFGSYSRGFLLWAARVNSGTNNSLKFRIGNSAATAWDTEKTILDDTNYSTYITSVNYANSAGKLGTSTLGSSSQPIYLNGGTPTACSFKIWKGTLSQYNAISSKDSNTLYFITD